MGELTARCLSSLAIPQREVVGSLGVEPSQHGSEPRRLAAGTPNEEWSGRRDLNPRPTGWEPVALPLSYVRKMVSPVGIEPTTLRLRGENSTN